MAWPQCGHNGLIYVSGSEVPGANSWSVTLDTESVELRKFGDSWVERCVTFNSASVLGLSRASEGGGQDG